MRVCDDGYETAVRCDFLYQIPSRTGKLTLLLGLDIFGCEGGTIALLTFLVASSADDG